MALTLAQRAELETIVKLLQQGEKPNISEAVNRRVVRLLREVLGDLAPGPDGVAFDESPVRSLLQAVLAADTAWTTVPGPVLMSSRVVQLNWVDFDVDFTFVQQYAGSPSDPDGATYVLVQLGKRSLAGEITWIDQLQATWDLVIGAAPVTINDSISAILQTDKIVMRFRFLDASTQPISDWSVTDELQTT